MLLYNISNELVNGLQGSFVGIEHGLLWTFSLTFQKLEKMFPFKNIDELSTKKEIKIKL